ncbi:hypothetical protein MW887_008068 [Aspergillus wentii]|nr:hypothetical protein MW887_008068 [Aspergillus wentii]
MNCPSRTDDTLLHDDWNQNPPRLAPDLTTRQDLNGISNAREQKDNKNGLAGVVGLCFDGTGDPPPRVSDPENHLQTGQGLSLTLSGRPVAHKTNVDVGNLRSNDGIVPSYQRLKDWGLWLLSVLCVSGLISHRTLREYFTTEPHQEVIVERIPAPIILRRSTCAQGGVRGDDYNLSLHVGALFIILGVSTLGCAFPILATRFPGMRIPPSFLFFVSHFGTGVLIATAFVHLLPTAFQTLGDPCLSKFWTTDYPAMPGAIALGGIFLVTVIEMVFSPARHVCRGGTRAVANQMSSPQPSTSESTTPRIEVYDESGNATEYSPPSPGFEGRPHLRDMGPLNGRSSSMSRAISRIGEDAEGIRRIESAPEREAHHDVKLEFSEHDAERNDSDAHSFLTPEQKQKKEVMQVFLLEMGILFHSVFIGMSLSVSVGSEFVILLIAICFHQTFEGLALGSRISALPWPKNALQPWLMSLAYGCTTPIGQAIGLATHTLYSPDSEVGLLLVGTMNAISSGLLIFASLVELMSEDFLSDESWKILRGRKRVYACILVFLGAFCMSIVGAWA